MSEMDESFLTQLKKFTLLTPGKKVATFLDSGPNGGTISREISYHDLETLSDQLAVRILESNLKKGDRFVRFKFFFIFFCNLNCSLELYTI